MSWTFPNRHVVFSWNTVSTLCNWGLVQATAAWLVFMFRGSYRKKIEFWHDQCSHGQTAFCSYVLPQIALYVQKVIYGKNKTSLYTYGCFLVSAAKVVQFLSIKKSIPCSVHSCLNFYLKKREGGFLATTICALETKKFILDRQLAPVLKS